MIIKTLRLVNFRQFVGETVINFSTRSSKKVTLVIGENTTGKSTLLESFSWVFYGTDHLKLKSIWNYRMLQECLPDETITVEGSVELIHDGITYKVNRSVSKTKRNSKFTNFQEVFFISYIDKDGNSQSVYKDEARQLINTIIPSNLFSYFFFKGEQIEQIGNDMSNYRDSVKSREFINAVRGLLGFNYLYSTIDHLDRLINEYDKEISDMQKDDEIARISSDIVRLRGEIDQIKVRIEGSENQEKGVKSLREEEEYYSKRREEVSSELEKYAAVSEKQKRTRQLEDLIKLTKDEINELQKSIFSHFSSRGYEFIANKLALIAKETLKKEKAVDKGIPSVDASSIDYIINVRKECLCGEKIVPGDEKYNNLIQLKKYLPPVGIGTEVEKHKAFLDNIEINSKRFYEDFFKKQKSLHEKDIILKKYNEELHELNEKIEGVPDTAELKKQEQEYSRKLFEISHEIDRLENEIKEKQREIDSLEKEKTKFAIINERVFKLLKYQAYSKKAKQIIEKYCTKHEKIKRAQLEESINNVFTNIFKTDIRITLSDNYELNISGPNKTKLEDLETSTSQSGILAFSFIAGIIDLASRQSNTSDDEESYFDLDNEIKTEPYPLVMDAPSSSFDIRRIKAFSSILPKIAEQIIVFVKDTDGNYLKDELIDNIGVEYELVKIDDYHTKIKLRGEFNE